MNSAVVTEAARQQREHGYTRDEAMWMAIFAEWFRAAGIPFASADDIPTESKQ